MHIYLLDLWGTGKTSIAKIFAKTINCESTNEGVSCEKCDICKLSNNNENVDIIEMDAASNNGVDEVREIKNHVTFMPTFSKYKIYIIDEVHMLSSGAFNALLKTLEEPPKHVIFILATTEPQKVPLTIISRCQCFEFKSIPNSLIEERIKYICSKEKIKISEAALKQIGEDSNGGLRDAIGLLDQLNSYTNGNINIEDVLKINGRVSLDSFNELFNNMIDNNLEGLFNISDKYNSEGKDYVLICEDIIKFLKNSLIDYQINNDNELIGKIGKDNVTKFIFEITDYIGYMRNLKEKKIFFDLLLIKLSGIIETNVRISTNEPEIVIEKKEVPEVKEEPKVEEKKEEIKEETPVVDEKYNKYDELMKIRLNNILAGADKESIKKYLEFINNLESDLDNLEERQIYNLLLDCEIVAGSCDGIVITTDSRVLLEELYDNLFNIENLINNKLSSNIKACFDLNEDWVKTSEVYRKRLRNKEKIDILDETEVLNSITETKNVKKNEFEDLLEIGEM